MLCLSVGSTSAFTTPTTSVAFVGRTGSVTISGTHAAGCVCPSCTSSHQGSCVCSACRQGTALFADVADEVATEDVPAEVAALDGVESDEEAHNVERPARQQLKKKRVPKGKDLGEFEVGSTVTGSVKSITNYGAFIDIGATTDGLLHISQLSSGYVANVGDILSEGQEVEVRIVSIDSAKGQVALSLMTQEEASNQESRQPRERKPRQQRRDDSQVLSALSRGGWDAASFVEGTVVSTVDFGCFVRVDASVLNNECEGSFDGLVHISALAKGRVGSVTDVVSVDDKVQVRVKSITGSKVSLTMLSEEDEQESSQSSVPVSEGAKDWKESAAKLSESMPTFKNGPIIEDRRK